MSTADARRRVERARAQLLRAELELARREEAERAHNRAELIVRLEATPWDELSGIDRLALTSHRIQVSALTAMKHLGEAMIAAREGR